MIPVYYTYCVARLIRKNINGVLIHVLRQRNSHLPFYNLNETSRKRTIASLCRRISLQDFSCDYFIHCSYSLKAIKYDEILQTSESLSKDILDKVKYNCILAENTVKVSWNRRKAIEKRQIMKERERRKNEPDIPISLRYVQENIETKGNTVQENTEDIVLPFSQDNNATSSFDFEQNEYYKFYSDRTIDTHSDFSEGVAKTKDWLKDYEFYNDSNETETNRSVTPWRLNYGTPDKSVPISSVPCGGCGAFLQCQDTGIPGYLPSELVKYCTKAELRALKCQRCHFLERYNLALNLSVSPDEYPRLLSRIENEYALVVLLVDIVDFPCSLWPGIIEIIGTKRPVIVVGNKIDLLPSDSSNFLSYALSWFEQAVSQSELANANVKHVTLISAETGFGVEHLITALQTIWKYKGDVYLLGCTNVGKSTLFNKFLQSDYCKVQAVDIMQRATTSPWPGTTLNLLKFPIFRLDGCQLYERVQRLQKLQRQEHQQLKLLREQQKKQNFIKTTLIGHLGRTFCDTSSASDAKDPFSLSPSISGNNVKLPGLNPHHKDFVEGKWCYDTPGTIHPDQIIDILTAQELVYLLPRKMILPRTFNIHCGDSVLIAGLARLDFEEGPEKCRFTVFAANILPITICRTVDVEKIYESLATSSLLLVPGPNPQRLVQWPGLSPHSHSFKVTGISRRESSADIVMSSAGWIAVTPEESEICTVRAWTPFARGIHFRQPSLLRYSVSLCGKKIKKSPAYHIGRAVKF